MSRRMVWALAGAGVAAVMVGGAVSQGTTPASSSHALSAATSSAVHAPASTMAAAAPESTTAAPTSAAAPTSSAAVLPVLAMACTGGSAEPQFAHRITAVAPYTVAIDYGDGDSYTNDDQHLGAIFSHRYHQAGTFTVGAVLTDASGQTASATCAYSWTAPAPVHATVPRSSTGSGSGNSYVNVDGNTIHSPVTASSAPSGATARCKDGTWSFSQHHSGTCSGHHGVAEWL